MRNDPVEIVQSQVEAYNRHDLDALIAHFHSEVRVYDFGKTEPTAEGRTALRAMFAPLFAQNPELRCEIVCRMAVGVFVVDEERITGANRFPSGIHGIAIYRVVDGLITEMWFLM